MFSLSVNNFRGFLHQEIDFAKINILIGENCSGKSSLIKLLLAMKQSLLPQNENECNLTLSGDYSDLGNYHEAVYNHQTNRKISFKFKLAEDYNDYYFRIIPSVAIILEEDIDPSKLNKILKRDLEKTSLKFLRDKIDNETYVEYQINSELDKHNISTKFLNKKLGEVKIKFIENFPKDNSEYVYFQQSCDIFFNHFPTRKMYSIKNVKFDKSGFMTLIWGTSLKTSIDRDYKDLDNEQRQELFYQIAFFLLSQNYISDFFKKIEYINPIASQPERIFTRSDFRKHYSFNNIEKVVRMLAQKKEEDADFIKAFSNLVSKFGLADDIDLRSSQELPVQELRIKINDIWSNIADVGYGVALQLPILFEALYSERVSKESKILLIEQPEVHVHPRLQAKLIEVLCSLSNNTSYIIETHSEHIVRKLQSIIKNSQFNLKPSDVAITYFHKKNKQLIMQKHELDEKGRLIPNLPSGFFDSTYLLAKELLY
jgi:predicted ATPase